MFGLFKKKETGPTIINKVWINTQQKWNGCLQLLQQKPSTIFVVWFDETFTQLNTFLEQHNHPSKVIMYRQVSAAHANDYVFAEHYPLVAKEKELFEKLNANNVVVLCGLDEPFFETFISERLVDMLGKLGMKEDDLIEHSMITSSIIRAQEKITSKVIIDNTARSQKEWLERNVS